MVRAEQRRAGRRRRHRSGATLAQVRARFESIPEREVPAHAAAHVQPLTRKVSRQPTRLVYPLAVVAFRFPGIDSPDFLASFVLQGILDSERGAVRGLVDTDEALDGGWVSMPYVPEGQLGFATAALAPNGDPAKSAQRLETHLGARTRSTASRASCSRRRNAS